MKKKVNDVELQQLTNDTDDADVDLEAGATTTTTTMSACTVCDGAGAERVLKIMTIVFLYAGVWLSLTMSLINVNYGIMANGLVFAASGAVLAHAMWRGAGVPSWYTGSAAVAFGLTAAFCLLFGTAMVVLYFS
jgi:hypothetical protein